MKAEELAAAKLQESKQFQMMKSMMQQKSQEVVKLRQRLAQCASPSFFTLIPPITTAHITQLLCHKHDLGNR